MLGDEERLLLLSARRSADGAREALSHVFGIEEGFRSFAEATERNEEMDAWKATLAFYVEQVFRESGMLAERLLMPQLAQEIRAKAGKLKSTFRDTEYDHNNFGVESTALNAALAFLRSMEAMFDPSELGAGAILRTVLENTARIISEQGLEPENETQVRNAVHRILLYGFRDAQKEVEVPKILKKYRMDIAIPSLRAAAEYKFADSAHEVKKSLDEIYADMKAYNGDGNWQTFYAVIYMTAPYYHQKDIELDFRLSRVDINWHPIVLTGPGQRTK